jgi:hypothetical protein
MCRLMTADLSLGVRCCQLSAGIASDREAVPSTRQIVVVAPRSRIDDHSASIDVHDQLETTFQIERHQTLRCFPDCASSYWPMHGA